MSQVYWCYEHGADIRIQARQLYALSEWPTLCTINLVPWMLTTFAMNSFAFLNLDD